MFKKIKRRKILPTAKHGITIQGAPTAFAPTSADPSVSGGSAVASTYTKSFISANPAMIVPTFQQVMRQVFVTPGAIGAYNRKR